MTFIPPYTPQPTADTVTDGTAPDAGTTNTTDTAVIAEPDDGLTFPGTVIVRYSNGGSVRHYFGTRDEYTTWAGEHTPEQHAQVLAIEQA